VSFVGRLATYKYYNMDQVVAQSLTLFKRLAAQHRQRLAAATPPAPAAPELVPAK
jgi:UDP-galactopyranose mutase